MSPLLEAAIGCAALATLAWLLSVLTHEHSWVDRAWSIAPPIYVAFFAARAGFSDARLVLMSLLAAAWGARLTFNFARKGGYRRGGEDYRWLELKKRMSPPAFAAFNVGFVAGFQNVLLLLISLPAWVALEHRGAPLGALDAIAACLFAVLLAGETIADEQQWSFQEDKKARRARGERAPREFVTTGLWALSRHPNFFCEQAMWWTFYLFGVAAWGEWLHWTLVGPILLTLLFHGSTRFTEELTLRKYPSYASYQSRVWRLLPLGTLFRG
jgi:steroid 5-alpha reductase family enzyme